MSLYDLISHDPEVLGVMTLKELAIQVLARIDLDRPTRESDLVAQDAREAMKVECESILTDVREVGIPDLESKLKTVMEKYFGSFTEVII